MFCVSFFRLQWDLQFKVVSKWIDFRRNFSLEFHFTLTVVVRRLLREGHGEKCFFFIFYFVGDFWAGIWLMSSTGNTLLSRLRYIFSLECPSSLVDSVLDYYCEGRGFDSHQRQRLWSVTLHRANGRSYSASI